MTVSEWEIVNVRAGMWDLGISSFTLIANLGSTEAVRAYGQGGLGSWGHDAPSDTSDVGRCVRLLDSMAKAGHDWRGRIGEMAAVRSWAPLVPRWPEIEAAFRADEAAQKAWIPKYTGRGRNRRKVGFPPSRCWWLVSHLKHPDWSNPGDAAFGTDVNAPPPAGP